jgi:tetratricopeptide (TPR) repeat protein
MQGFALAALAVAAAALGAPALADTVRLKTGQVIKGKVQDRGGYVIVEKELPQSPTASAAAGVSGTAREAATVSVRIDRQEILSIEIDGQAPHPPRDLDVIVFVNGDELPGHVEVRGDGKEVVVIGDGDRGEVVLDSRQVRTILWSKKSEEEQRAGTASVGTTIQKLLENLHSPDETTRKAGRESLHQLGIYALPYLEARAQDPDPVVRDALRTVVEVARLRTYMTPALAERTPGLPRILVDGNEKERLAAMKEALVAAPRDCVPVLMHLARRDPSKDVRAFVLAQLSLLGRTQELLELLEARDGGLRFAAAIALGDNGVLIGVPLLIEGLKHDELAIRKISIQKLEAWTGNFRGYFADGDAERRAQAIESWEKWWREEGKTIVEKSLRNTLKKGEISEDDKTMGLAHWTNAQALWDKTVGSGIEGDARRKELYRVRFLLEKSLECYPQNPNARIAIAVLDYTELGEAEEAKKQLDLVLHRYDEDSADPARLLAHFHLGRVAQLENRYAEAEKHYRLASTIDPRNVDVLRGLGTLAFDRAVSEESLDKAARRSALEQSIKHFDDAIAAIDQYDMDLRENAQKAADAIAASQPFGSPKFLKSVDAVKRDLRLAAADLRYLRGRSRTALHDDAKALEDYRAALDLDATNTVYRDAVKFWEKKP